MNKTLKLLIIEDSTDDTLLLLAELKRHGYAPYHLRVATQEAFEAALHMEHWDIILADYFLGDFTGMDAIRLLKESTYDIPMIIISSILDEDQAVQLLRAGASDFVIKGRWARLIPAMEREIHEASNRRHLKKTHHIIERLRHYHLSTQLPNQHYFSQLLDAAINERHCAPDHDPVLAVVVIEIDTLDSLINSTGSQASEHLLRQIADQFSLVMQHKECIGTLPGERLIGYLTPLDTDVPRQIRNQILAPLQEARYPYLGKEQHITLHAGYSQYPGHGRDARALIHHAESAATLARHRIGERLPLLAYDSEQEKRAALSIQMENALSQALEKKQLTLHYQPIVDAKSHQIVGAEALLRWQHPVWGPISPVRFIPVAEETGLIIPISQWVLHNACTAARHWADMGHPIRVAVNISPNQIMHSNFLTLTQDIMEHTQCAAASLEMEITENIALNDPEHVQELINTLRGMGITISIDDFGTGYSSLSYLHQMRTNTLKIDRSFVIRMDAKENSSLPIVAAMISMAHALHMHTIAEGVETEAQLHTLKELDCDLIQGYWFSRPLPKEEFEVLLQRPQPFRDDLGSAD